MKKIIKLTESDLLTIVKKVINESDPKVGTGKKPKDSDMRYGVREWNSIRGIPPLVGCLENKKEFLCHPNVSQVFNKVNEIIK
jgi:hypothetical protein